MTAARGRGRCRVAAGGSRSLLAWLVLYPILVVVARGRARTRRRCARSRTARASGGRLWASLWISLASVVLAALVGVPLAFLFEWLEFPGRKLLGALVALPVVLPPLVGVIAFLFLYGESGFVGAARSSICSASSGALAPAGAGAILLVHAYSMYVYFYLFTRAGLARLDAAMLEAAQALGAGRSAHAVPGDPAARCVRRSPARRC